MVKKSLLTRLAAVGASALLMATSGTPVTAFAASPETGTPTPQTSTQQAATAANTTTVQNTTPVASALAATTAAAPAATQATPTTPAPETKAADPVKEGPENTKTIPFEGLGRGTVTLTRTDGSTQQIHCDTDPSGAFSLVDGEFTADPDETVTITVEPDPGYQIALSTVKLTNGAEQNGDSTMYQGRFGDLKAAYVTFDTRPLRILRRISVGNDVFRLLNYAYCISC